MYPPPRVPRRFQFYDHALEMILSSEVLVTTCGLGFKGLGFKGLGFKGLGFKGLGVQGFRVQGLRV